MALFFVALSLLLPVLLSIVFFPSLVRFLGVQAGHYLRRSSRTRRELLLARVATESKNYEAEAGHAETEDGDWEEVASVAKDGNKADKQWEGIVGFFHPFWYRLRFHLVCISLTNI
jgi:alpha-1,2-mannosyltransferase